MFLGTGKTMDMNWFLPLQAEAAPPDQSPIPEVLPPEQVMASTSTVDDRGPVTPVSSDEVKLKLQSAMNNLHEKIAARIEHDPEGYLKAIAALEKSVQKLPSSSDSALQKSLASQ
jgi:hypothetical protein